MGLFQSKPEGKKVHDQPSQGSYKPSSPNALSRVLHPAKVASQGATSGGRKRKQKEHAKDGKEKIAQRH